MERGTKLYNVCFFNGELQTFTFIQEQILDGATVPTYIVKDSNGCKALVATDYYQTSEAEAWKKYADKLETGISSMEEQIREYQEVLDDSRSELAETKSRLLELAENSS